MWDVLNWLNCVFKESKGESVVSELLEYQAIKNPNSKCSVLASRRGKTENSKKNRNEGSVFHQVVIV